MQNIRSPWRGLSSANYIARGLRAVASSFKKRKLSYWIWAVSLLVVGTVFGDNLVHLSIWTGLRGDFYRWLQGSGRSTFRPKWTVVVMIGDEEYWGSSLAGRSPLKRNYLADLITKLDSLDPAAIALDVNLRCPSSGDYPDYKTEDQNLLTAVAEVGGRRPVVVGKVLRPANDGGAYDPEPSVLDTGPFQGKAVTWGYTNLPTDIRQVPLQALLTTGITVDSFSSAVVRVLDQGTLDGIGSQDLFPFGSFINPDNLTVIKAGDLLTGDAAKMGRLKSLVAHHAAIIGGRWHARGPNLGDYVDDHPTPLGPMPGVYLHANWVEALLSNQTVPPWTEKSAKIIEIALAAALALCLALLTRELTRGLVVVLFCIGSLALSYFSWQNLGLFFDSSVPIILITAHAVFDQVADWRTDARKYVAMPPEKTAGVHV